ncbi:MAG: response regulator [Gammaproteobacteria bacterium]|nr:response regulator [Gammaproteobacteria bacterium]
MTGAPTIVCIIDDDASVRRSLQRLLLASGFRVEVFADAQSYLVHCSDAPCGCIVLDVSMPGIDGLELQARLEQEGQGAPIVFLTGHGDIPMSVRAVKAGAADFLSKPVDEAVLLAAVNDAVALHRQRLCETEVIEAIRQRIASLTPREKEVMRCVITGAANKQIAGDLGIAEKTVKIHRSRVMKKLEVSSVAALLLACLQAGVEPATKPSESGAPSS